jgi:hypothetical protein
MNNTKNLPSTITQETAVQLHHGGSQRVGALIDNALANLNREQAQAFSAKAAEQILMLEVQMRKQNIEYVTGRKVVEDHIETFGMLEKQGRLTRQVVDSTIKTGAGEMRITSKSGATCFVATATYGDVDHPNVRFLRAWRDGYLVHTSGGRRFIDWYWRTGPKLAVWVTRYPVLKRCSHAGLNLLVALIRQTWRLQI